MADNFFKTIANATRPINNIKGASPLLTGLVSAIQDIQKNKRLDEISRQADAINRQSELLRQATGLPQLMENGRVIPRSEFSLADVNAYYDSISGNNKQSQGFQPSLPVGKFPFATSGKQTKATKQLVSNKQDKQDASDILAMMQSQAQQRQNIYQPFLDYQQAVIDNAREIAKQRDIDSHISAGLAGLANNPYIYSAYTSRNPIQDVKNLAELYGNVAKTKDQLRYDPTQALANVEVSEAMGMPASSALASPEFLSNIIKAQSIANENAYRQGMLGLTGRELNEKIRQNQALEAIQREKINKDYQALMNSLTRTGLQGLSNIGAYSGMTPEQYMMILQQFGGFPRGQQQSAPQVQSTGNMIPKNALEF